jgi:hypothetical protein
MPVDCHAFSAETTELFLSTKVRKRTCSGALQKLLLDFVLKSSSDFLLMPAFILIFYLPGQFQGCSGENDIGLMR